MKTLLTGALFMAAYFLIPSSSTAADDDCVWAAMNPHPNVEKPYEGYRIPQLMVPWMEWAEILDKQRKYLESY